MANAKDELLQELGYLCIGVEIVCAEIQGKTLLIDYSIDEYEQFLSELNFSYDDKSWTQKLHGTAWLSDGSWLEREAGESGDYWCEYWALRKLPKIPSHLTRPNDDRPVGYDENKPLNKVKIWAPQDYI